MQPILQLRKFRLKRGSNPGPLNQRPAEQYRKIIIYNCTDVCVCVWGGGGDAKVLGKLPVPGRSTNLD